jgi:hypothetical protein
MKKMAHVKALFPAFPTMSGMPGFGSGFVI